MQLACHTRTPPGEVGKILILFYRSQVSPSVPILVIGQDVLCVAQLHLFFQTQREPSIRTTLVPTADLNCLKTELPRNALELLYSQES